MRRRRISDMPGEFLALDRTARLITTGAIALGVLILLAVLSTPFL